MNAAYRELDLQASAGARQRRRIEAAAASIVELRDRLARVPVPTEAARLHRRLLRLVRLQVAFAQEVAGLVAYLPVQARESRVVAAATARLRARLDAAAGGDAQSDALEAYRLELRPIVRRLERASAPAVLEPTRTGEVARLERLDALAAKLGRALVRQQAGEIDRLFPQFVRASTNPGTTPAERQAVVAYNRRVAAIADERVAVTTERARLDLALR